MRLYKRGSIWWGWYYQGTQRICASTRCQDKRAAEAVLREWERHASDPSYAATNATTLGEAIGRLLIDRANKGRAEPTINCYRTKAGHLVRMFGADITLAKIDATLVDEYINTRLNEGAKRHTIYKELVTLRSTFKVAKRRGEFSPDIAAIMPNGFSADYKPRERVLTVADTVSLLAELPAERAAHAAFIVATGARRGESDRAMRADIDWVRGIVRLRGTKTAAAARAVPIAGFSVELLRYSERYAAGVDGRLFQPWPDCHRKLSAARARAALGADGDDTKARFNALTADAKRALLKQSAISPNDLRRTYATWLRQVGIEPHLIALALGHKDSRMAERVYGRMLPEALGVIFNQRLEHASNALRDERPAQLPTRASFSANQEYRPLPMFDQFRRQPEQDEWQQSDSTNAGKSGGVGTTTLTGTDSASRPSVAINARLKR